mgnify:CR=1 FL=1|jgi:hypothetical protein
MLLPRAAPEVTSRDQGPCCVPRSVLSDFRSPFILRQATKYCFELKHISLHRFCDSAQCADMTCPSVVLPSHAEMAIMQRLSLECLLKGQLLRFVFPFVSAVWQLVRIAGTFRLVASLRTIIRILRTLQLDDLYGPD